MIKRTLAIFFLLPLLFACSQKEKGEAKSPPAVGVEAGLSAPDFMIKNLRGGMTSLSQHRGKVVLINFWATWCAPCREEIPDFIALRARYHARNVEIVGIAIDAAAPVKAYAAEMKMPYPILIGEGPAHELARALGNTTGALPYTVVIDPAGKIVHRHLGRLPGARLEAILTPLATLSGAP